MFAQSIVSRGVSYTNYAQRKHWIKITSRLNNLEGSDNLLVFVALASNFAFTWVMPVAYDCSCTYGAWASAQLGVSPIHASLVKTSLV